MKRIKAELVPDVLTAGEWSRWNTEARAMLKKDSAFGNVPDKVDQFTVRDKPISFEEKTYNKFKAEKNFFDRVHTIEEFLQAGQAEPDSRLVRRDVRLLHRLPEGLHGGLRDRGRELAAGAEDRRAYPFLNPGGLPTLRGAVRAHREPSRRPSPASTTPS